MLIVAWAVAFVLFVIVEIATANALVSIWFAFGSLAAMLAAIADLEFTAQLGIFVAASVVILIATRPLARKMQGKKYATNYELDVGKTAVVIEKINNNLSEGRVKLDGTDWSARSDDDSVIEEGTVVTVRRVDGAKLIVSRSA